MSKWGGDTDVLRNSRQIRNADQDMPYDENSLVLSLRRSPGLIPAEWQ